jgi:hypothetical protein
LIRISVKISSTARGRAKTIGKNFKRKKILGDGS